MRVSTLITRQNELYVYRQLVNKLGELTDDIKMNDSLVIMENLLNQMETKQYSL